MNLVMHKSKLLIYAMVISMLTMIGVAIATPVQAHAVGDVNVKVENGKLDVSGGGMEGNSTSTSVWNNLLNKYKGLIVGFSGVGAISMIAFFIFNFMKLGAVSSNPSERAKVLQGLIWSGLAAAGLGAVGLIVGFFYGVFR